MPSIYKETPPQSTSPAAIKAKYFESLVPSSVKNKPFSEVGSSSLVFDDLGDAVPLPWWRRRKGTRPTPRQDTEPVRLSLRDFLPYVSPILTPLPTIAETGSSMTHQISSELMDKTANKMKLILKRKPVLY